MDTRKLIRLSIVFVVLVALLMFELQTVIAAPPPPIPISPLEGSTIVTPTFSWSASVGAVKYELELGPQSDPNLVSWTAQTVNLTLTPENAANFPNAPLYWRVRAIDSAAVAGAWTSKINFTKTIPAPNLVSPADGSTSVIVPTFEWQVVEGAAYYRLELSTSPTFVAVEASFDTYSTRFTPVSTITHGLHYWRVSGVDADGHVGTPGIIRSFTKGIPAPALFSPYDAHPNIHVPTFEWQAVEGAAYYRLELSTSPTFVAVEASFDTYNTRLTPVSTITHGLHYWRVSGVDADGHVGTPSASWSFTKTTNGPVLVSPNADAIVDIPTMEWQAVDGAAYYKVELSISPTFVPVDLTLTTYNLRITPVDALGTNSYYWRVSGVDADGNVGENTSRMFTLVAPPGAIDPNPILLSPVDASTITTDPTYQWSRMIGADHYTVVVSTNPAFSTTFDSVNTDYDTYTPSIAESPDAYPNGTYYWRVDAKSASGTPIGTSAAFSFTKQEVLPLIAPVDAVTGLTVDPTYQWSQIVGAHHYDLTVSISPSFNTTFSSVLTDYNSYTPAIATSPDAYPNGTYYWRVEAKTSGGIVIATSAGRSFTKQAVLPLIAPVDGAIGLATDPTYQWSQIVGAHHYDLTVSTSPGFSTTFSSVLTDYNSYTPAIATSPDAYPNGTYYWKVEAKTSGGTMIVASAARSFTKHESLPLIAPADGAELTLTPTFQWGRIVGAHHYRLFVSTSPSFSTTYESLLTDYTTYTPYSPAGKAAYAVGTYYWKVEGKTSVGTTITTSDARTFTIALRKVYLPFIIR